MSFERSRQVGKPLIKNEELGFQNLVESSSYFRRKVPLSAVVRSQCSHSDPTSWGLLGVVGSIFVEASPVARNPGQVPSWRLLWGLVLGVSLFREAWCHLLATVSQAPGECSLDRPGVSSGRGGRDSWSHRWGLSSGSALPCVRALGVPRASAMWEQRDKLPASGQNVWERVQC